MFSTAQFHTATEPATIDELRAKYREERDRRIRPEGLGQYRSTGGSFGFYAVDPYSEKTMRQPVSDRVEVLVIGAGFGGLLTAARLREAGVESIRLMDEAGDVGGTWYWNRYPGIHCDIESYVYMPLLEEVGYVPSWRYAPGEEIRQHAIAIAKRFDLYRDTLFHTRATGLKWNDEAEEWTVETDRGDRFRARYVVTSSGTLTQPKLPNIPGIETFRGHTFHTSRWDYGYTGGTADGGLVGLTDKRVAVVGTGATGVQVIPHLGRDAQQLLVFQRTPSTIDVRDNRLTDPRWAASLGPGWQRERMENFLEVLSGEPVTESLVNDGWTRTVQLQRKFLSGSVDKSLSDDEREARDEIADWEVMSRIRARVDEIVDNPETAELLKPWYRYMCKRPCFSDTYLQTFNRPNVTLVDTASTGGITRMTETSIVVGDAEYEVDCVIFATGFDVGVSGILSGTLPVAGRDGKSLLAAWGEGPRTLHGFYTYGFPNLFNLGVMQNANSVNYAHILQEQAEHIAAVIQAARATVTGVVEPSPESEEAWCAHIAETATSDGGFLAECTPGYYNGEGTRVASPTTYSPGPVAFHHLLRHWRQESMQDVLRSSPAGGKARRVHAGPKAAG